MAFNEAIADAICEQLADGKSLREICRGEGMPSRSTVLRRLGDDPEFEAKCARARILQAEAIADDMADIEERTLNGTIDPAAARAVLSSKQWRASKLAPKKYGDKLDVNHGGGVTINISQAEAEL